MHKTDVKTASITIDVETDWGGRQIVDETNVGVEKELPWMLDLLRRHKIKATFFVNANLLPKYQKQILQIKKEGHEIASHGFAHNDHSKMNEQQLKTSFKKCSSLFKKYLDVLPIGFRAPQFRVNRQLFNAVETSGFKYDSSIVAAILPGRYSNPNARKEPYKITKKLIEFPISSINLLNFPAGLLWGNKVGFSLFRIFISVFGIPSKFIFYLHPFDLSNKKYKFHVPWHIKLWYGFGVSNPKVFLEKLIVWLESNQYEFVTLEKLHKNV